MSSLVKRLFQCSVQQRIFKRFAVSSFLPVNRRAGCCRAGGTRGPPDPHPRGPALVRQSARTGFPSRSSCARGTQAAAWECDRPRDVLGIAKRLASGWPNGRTHVSARTPTAPAEPGPRACPAQAAERRQDGPSPEARGSGRGGTVKGVSGLIDCVLCRAVASPGPVLRPSASGRRPCQAQGGGPAGT